MLNGSVGPNEFAALQRTTSLPFKRVRIASTPSAVAGTSPAVQNGIYSIGNPVSEFIQVRFQCASAPASGQFKRHQITRKR